MESEMAFFGNRRLLLALATLTGLNGMEKEIREQSRSTVKIALFFLSFFSSLPTNFFFFLHLPRSSAIHYTMAAFFPYLRLVYTLNSSTS